MNAAARATGFTLVELMIAMLLGLVVVLGVGSVFISSQRVYATTRALADAQDSARVAFDLLARDIRHAGLTACGNPGRVANVLVVGPNGGGSAWWANWNNALHGYAGNDPDVAAGTAEGARVAGTSSLQLLGADDTSFAVVSHDARGALFVLAESSTDLVVGDVFIVCDYDHAAIFRSTSYSASARTVGHAAGKDNCSTGLGFPTACVVANSYAFAANASMTRLHVADWYVGRNPDGGLSLYRLSREGDALKRQELVRGVAALSLSYHQVGLSEPFVTADKVTRWGDVTEVRTLLTVQGGDASMGNGVARSFALTTLVRNRAP